MSEIRKSVDNPLFSIIIPTYNYAHTLERAIHSVFKQNKESFELLVINDGSKDNTEELLSDLQKKSKHHFRVINQSNRGQAAVRNLGIQVTSGKYLIFLDADDELTENSLHNLELFIKDHSEPDFIIGAHISVTPEGNERLRPRPPIPSNPEKRFKKYLIEDSIPVSHGASAMHRRVFDNYKYPEKFRCVEDIPVFAYILANFNCQSLNKPVAKIHKHSTSMRHNVDKDLSIGLDLVEEVFSNGKIPENMMKYKADYTVRRLLSLFRSLYMSGRYSQALRYYLNAVKQSPAALLHIASLRKAIRSAIYCIWK
ncbi:glycosyltransferase family 2 protein [Endozoicomonas sp. 8E]|uniref:glycosyltransferase family 2 protein n=1 Tax=Endozoicomonas sp. 8E TaxID=3035692 RepID=UPI002938D7D8|nr:glycosyltransferase family 2 protein [Endozoicomonas sp. 8E]WOG28458.1 glycosyltransferase family 2 protein [Endozoicomonas sp. 8E]